MSRYLYHAHAVGLAGNLTFPPSAAALGVFAGAVLPPSGADSTCKCGPLAHPFVRFSKAETSLQRFANAAANTYGCDATATLEGLDVNGVFKAGRITATLRSRRKEGEKEGSFELVEGKIEDLSILGKAVAVNLDIFSGAETFEKMLKHPNCKNRLAHGEPDRNGKSPKAMFKLTKDFGSLPAGVSATKNCLKIDDFGSVYFGELLAEPSRRRLTMLRFELGSPVKGVLDAAQLDTNGEFHP